MTNRFFLLSFVFTLVILQDPSRTKPVLAGYEYDGGGDADDHDVSYVTCGSVVKIQQQDTGYHLNSSGMKITGGDQQLVTFVDEPSAHDTLWWVRPENGHNDDGGRRNSSKEASASRTCEPFRPIPCGAIVRFTHLSTRKNLHSHHASSPLSNQQEITGFGEDGEGDTGDNWRVVCATSSSSSPNPKLWERDMKVRLEHVDTGVYLGTSKKTAFNQNTCGNNCPIMGHLESFGRSVKDANSLVKVEQGIHLSK